MDRTSVIYAVSLRGAGQRRKLRRRKPRVELARLKTELIWGDQDKSLETRMPKYLATETLSNSRIWLHRV